MNLQISAVLRAYFDGSFIPAQLIAEICDRIDAYPDPAVWISRVPRASLLARAAALDPAQRDQMPLWGVPFAVKDNIDVAGMDTTAACPAFAYRATQNAVAVEHLIAAGAILVGKTNLDQFATGLNGTRSPYGAPRNVFDPQYISGGSSSGSGVAVGAGLVSFALGTDTAGSGRVPAAFNNIVGLKPTKGAVSATGMVPACRSIDCISVLAANVGDADLVYRVMRGFDPTDGFSRSIRDIPLRNEKFCFGVLAAEDREFCGDHEAASLYQSAIDQLEFLGGTSVAIDYAPFRDAAALLYEGAFVAERYVAIGDFAAAHRNEMDATVAHIVAESGSFTAAEAFQAIYRLHELAQLAKVQWERIDFLLLPTAPTIFTVAQLLADPIRYNSLLGIYTNFVNLLDCAAMAIPAGFCSSSHLPFGVSLIGPAFTDRALAYHADRLHRALKLPVANTGEFPAADAVLATPSDGRLFIAVAGAHLSGMPLNPQLTSLGATLSRAALTAPGYRLYALANTVPAKPGLVRDPGFTGPGIAIEIWSLSQAAFGTFVASLPRPMCIGKIELAEGGEVPGFLCEPAALAGATDITHSGGWRAFCRDR